MRTEGLRTAAEKTATSITEGLLRGPKVQSDGYL